MSRLLIVDDDELALQLYELLLEDQPAIKLTVASSGTEALEKMEATDRTQWPEYIMVDLNMPDMSGFELVAELQGKYGIEKLPPIFILSNSVSSHDKDKAASFPSVQGFLSKPLSLERLQQSFNQPKQKK